jgi:hypothetical protein
VVECVIVATSTLELGIDVGDLDRVIQVNDPPGVASFLQRIGRTGRLAAGTRNCLFLALGTDDLLCSAGLLHLWGRGYVEPVLPPPEPRHIVAQQLLALCLQEHRMRRLWTALAATLSHLTDSVQRIDDASIRMRADRTHEMWKAGTGDAVERLCLPEVDERALAGLKFSAALPERLATATLAARLADLDSAALVLAEPAASPSPTARRADAESRLSSSAVGVAGQWRRQGWLSSLALRAELLAGIGDLQAVRPRRTTPACRR